MAPTMGLMKATLLIGNTFNGYMKKALVKTFRVSSCGTSRQLLQTVMWCVAFIYLFLYVVWGGSKHLLDLAKWTLPFQ